MRVKSMLLGQTLASSKGSFCAVVNTTLGLDTLRTSGRVTGRLNDPTIVGYLHNQFNHMLPLINHHGDHVLEEVGSIPISVQ